MFFGIFQLKIKIKLIFEKHGPVANADRNIYLESPKRIEILNTNNVMNTPMKEANSIVSNLHRSLSLRISTLPPLLYLTP